MQILWFHCTYIHYSEKILKGTTMCCQQFSTDVAAAMQAAVTSMQSSQ